MLVEWLEAAMRGTQFELIENEPPWYGEIPECEGVWAVGDSAENCRIELASVLGGWLLLGLRMGDPIPVMGGIDLAMQNEPLVHG